jgi:hypothetical protein
MPADDDHWERVSGVLRGPEVSSPLELLVRGFSTFLAFSPHRREERNQIAAPLICSFVSETGGSAIGLTFQSRTSCSWTTLGVSSTTPFRIPR